MSRTLGILTGGGDAPGLNAVIRAFTKVAVGQHGWRVIGIEDSFNGLLETPHRLIEMDMVSCQGLLHRGGTVLGTTNRGDPFDFPGPDGTRADRSQALADAIRAVGIEGLIVIGGDGTQAIAHRLMVERGIGVIGVPKTIDNDLSATDRTFGFQSAVDVATDALDRLHTTAESHERVLVLEVMGRDAGHIALHSGIAGGADVILIPEIPYEPEQVAAKIHTRQQRGRPFSIVVVAEGALPADATGLSASERKQRLKVGGGAGAVAVAQLAGLVEAEMRVCVLGHLQRGGSPVPADRLLATRLGVGAASLVDQDAWGQMVRVRNGEIGSVPLLEAIDTYRLVDVHGGLVQAARATGISFGA